MKKGESTAIFRVDAQMFCCSSHFLFRFLNSLDRGGKKKREKKGRGRRGGGRKGGGRIRVE